LPLFVRSNVVNLVADVHVPVNAFRGSSCGISAAGFNEQLDLVRRVLFITGIMRKDFELRSVKLLWPVTLLAGLLRRTQIVDRRWNWTRIGIKGGGKHLPQTRHL